MKHHLENHLWERIPAIGITSFGRKTTRDVINEMLAEGLIQSPKQAWRTLEKWCAKNPPWYEYGVCLDLGWKLPAGRDHWKTLASGPPDQFLDMKPQKGLTGFGNTEWKI